MKFRKKPVEIEALQFDGTLIGAQEVCGWIESHGGICTFEAPGVPASTNRVVIHISTLEGTMKASGGDWVIRGVQGEFYPCKPDIFEATYDPVTE